jgi:hypothetical protein
MYPISYNRRPSSDTSRWLGAAHSSLALLKSMREGGRVERAVAVMSLMLHARRFLAGERDPYDSMIALGLEPRSLSLENLWFDLLRSSAETMKVLPFVSPDEQILHWVDVGVAALLSRGKLEELLLAPEGTEQRVAEAIAPRVWGRANHVQLLGERGSEFRELKVELVPLPVAGALVGSAAFESIVVNGGRQPEGRTVLVRGPSGVGKSTIARKLAERIVGPDARLLQIAASIMDVLDARALRELARFLRPDVILLDDLRIDDDGLALLTRLELVREPHVLVIVTQMTDPDDVIDGVPVPGSLYHAGMRPGRIDEIVTIPTPSADERRAILANYLGDAPPDGLAERTDGLTGAYLKELAFRLRERGAASIDDEIASLLAQAPIAYERKPRRRHVRRGAR